MSTNDLTIATLTVNNYTGTITLNKNLTVNTGGSMNSGTIVQGSGGTGTTLTFSGGTFVWSGGNINYTGGALSLGTLSISAGAEVDFTYGGGPGVVHLGDNINNSGTLKLANESEVELDNRPTITSATTGKINTTVANLNGLILPLGDPAVTIQNSGTIQQAAGVTGTYTITDPVNNKAAGALIEVDGGTLEFVKGDPSSGVSITQSAGTIQIAGGAELEADHNITQSGGTTKTSGTGTANVFLVNSGTFTVSGGLLQVGDANPTIATLDVTGNVAWSGGTSSLFYDLATQSPSTISITGTLGITPATTFQETLVGTGNATSPITAMTAAGGINRIAGTNNLPTGWSASLSADQKSYLLTSP